ncbi:condensation domain-containing protein [Nocardia sp. NPDC047038]|uniref:condensation domain-containing protein n=1 Tax=Nocardia sp. NPDC047038 TaxID=3154338 RepID=UPI0033F4D412
MTTPGYLPAAPLQLRAWHWYREAPPALAFGARGLLGSGRIDDDRLIRAIEEVVSALPLLTAAFADDGTALVLPLNGVGGRAQRVQRTDLRGSERPRTWAVELLRADRQRPTDLEHDALVRFHVMRLSAHEVVLAVVAHELILDARSRYAVLGAIWQAYFGRFRASQIPDFTTGVEQHRAAIDRIPPSRRDWWARRLHALPSTPDPPDARSWTPHTARLELAGDRWRAFTEARGALGDNGSFGLSALLAWLLRQNPDLGSGRLRVDVDLRQHLKMGPILGPFTDHVVLDVSPPPTTRPGFADIMLRTQAAVLDALVHYLPYYDIVDIAVDSGVASPHRAAARWDTAVHICRAAPSSAATRGERSLADLGLSIELFREADLLGGDVPVASPHWDGTRLDLRVGESGPDRTVVLLHHLDPAAAALLPDLAAAVETAITDPGQPLAPMPTPSNQRQT